MSSVFTLLCELFRPLAVSAGGPETIDMAKHTRRKKQTSPARAKPRTAGRPVAAVETTHDAPAAKAKPAKKRGLRRGLHSALGHDEHERDNLDQSLHELNKSELPTQE